MNSILDGSLAHEYGIGASVALLSIVMVFLILLLIIIICEAVGKVIERSEKNAPVVENTTHAPATMALNLNDEDATVAALIASIEMRNQIKKNVKVISVRKVN